MLDTDRCSEFTMLARVELAKAQSVHILNTSNSVEIHQISNSYHSENVQLCIVLYNLLLRNIHLDTPEPWEIKDNLAC